MMPPRTFRKSVLPSGIAVITETMPERHSVSIGAWLRCGSRDEPEGWLGISHFLEHMMFKGTERRDARAIAHSIESLGGHLDAFTAREQVCYEARALSEDLPQVVEVLADIVCRSRLDNPEVDREKSVVCEEILACEDNPEEKLNDLLAEQVWGNHALGRPILGTTESVSALTPGHLRSYFRSRYRGDQWVVCATGAVDHDALADLVLRHFAPPDDEALPLSEPPPAFRPTVRHVEQDLLQLYVALGTRAVPDRHPDRYPLVVLNAMVGGGMSSRLFQAVREEAGLAYSIFSVPDFYRDAGVLTIQMGVSADRVREALARVRAELEHLASQGLSEEEFATARAQVRGGLMMDQESVSGRMFQIAYEEICRRTYTPPAQQVERVMAVTRDQVADVARRYLSPSRFALTALGPVGERALSESDWPVEA